MRPRYPHGMIPLVLLAVIAVPGAFGQVAVPTSSQTVALPPADLQGPSLGPGGPWSLEAQAESTVEQSVEATSGTPSLDGLDGPIATDGLLASTEEPGPSPLAVGAASAGALALIVAILAATWGSFRMWLMGSFLVPLFSRINKDRVLENDLRNRVHEAVLQNPGITINEIHKVLGIGWGTTVYHLNRLEAERLIVSERHRQNRRYFKNGGGIVNEDKSAFSELKSRPTNALARAVLATPGSVQRELCAKVGISAPLGSKYLLRLEKANLVVRERHWKEVKVFPTERLGRLAAEPTLTLPV